MEKILRITEDRFKLSSNDYQSYEGFQIVTDKQTIKLGISDSQCCCEQSGYFMSEDNLWDFINAELLSIEIVDAELGAKIKNIFEHGLDSGDVMFVNINTSKGLLQFTAYNYHNGYYGHDAVVVSEQLHISTTL